MINFAENLNKMITAGLGGETEAPHTEVAVGHRIQYLDASGPVASFETNIVAPLRKLLVTMLPIQAGSGDPSPENIRPISGRSYVTVTRSRKNLCSTGEFVIPVNSARNLYWEGSLTGTFTISADKSGITDVGNPNADRWIQVVVDGIERELMYSATSLTVTGTITSIKIYGSLAYAKASGTVAIQIETGSVATEYEPYDGSSAVIQLGQTVYGGTVDVTTGKMTVDRAMVTFDGGFLKHSTISTAFYKKNAVSNAAEGECVSNLFKYKASNITGIEIGEFTIDSNYTRVAFKTDIFSDASECNAYLAEHPLTVVYPLADPVEIDLTPEQITALIGDNNVWSDAGDVDVTYVYYEESEGY